MQISIVLSDFPMFRPRVFMGSVDCFCFIAFVNAFAVALKDPQKITPYISINSANFFFALYKPVKKKK